jgi:hypothetical protein
MNRASIICIKILFAALLSFPLMIKAQETYTQIWSEIDLLSAINDKWSGELDLGGSYSNTPSEDRILKTNTERHIVAWAHYQFSSRWIFSSFLGYYHNKDVPEIGQYEAPEWRFALQARYYFHKTGYTLYTDGRTELRSVADEEGDFETWYRYHQKLKFLKPLNSQVLRKGVLFLYASDEIIFRSLAKEEGLKYFDCNLFTLGAGYLITDDIQVELAYVNLFLPRDGENIIYNAASLTFTFNNLFRKLGKLVTGGTENPVTEE